MIEWEDFVLKKENGKELKLDDCKEPDEKFYIQLHVYGLFGGVCSKEELEQIAEIVHQAYLRKKENK